MFNRQIQSEKLPFFSTLKPTVLIEPLKQLWDLRQPSQRFLISLSDLSTYCLNSVVTVTAVIPHLKSTSDKLEPQNNIENDSNAKSLQQ